jgi:hypothetical protein
MRVLLAALAAAALISSGCGYIGDPQPPLANVPAPVSGLTAEQRGADIVIRFAVPTRTTEDMPLKGQPQIDLRIGTAGDPFDAAQWAAQAKRISGPKIENSVAEYEVPSAEWTGKDAIIGARVIGANGKISNWSQFAIVNVVAPPQTPQALRATEIPGGVRLSWEAAGENFRVYRRAGDETAFTPAGETAKNEWTDASTEMGKRYAYRVEGFVKLQGGRAAQSEPSQEAVIKPQGQFPPSAPVGLRAEAGPDSLELTWDSNPEAFVGAYRISAPPREARSRRPARPA